MPHVQEVSFHNVPFVSFAYLLDVRSIEVFLYAYTNKCLALTGSFHGSPQLAGCQSSASDRHSPLTVTRSCGCFFMLWFFVFTEYRDNAQIMSYHACCLGCGL